MGLTPPEAGLRQVLRNTSKQTAKVVVHVAPGDELGVSDDVAAQLIAGDHNAFTPVGPEPAEASMLSDELVDKLREDARALGIKRVGTKSPETLQREIDEALAAPPQD